MGHSETTDKHFKVYSPENGYTIEASIVKVFEHSKGGSVDLKLRTSSGPQGTKNVAPDRRGRPKKVNQDKEGVRGNREGFLEPGSRNQQHTAPFEIPLFTTLPNVPNFTDETLDVIHKEKYQAIVEKETLPQE
ncbi:hypothetical protein BJ878DRAFT_102129 [Calycina marina]|uniref:Uncharacterized protein n=1 Tax=Calycina marina TaxID=1763456 RepID=A0A9P8CFX9_9HELO|nr:hypothetical protein BJ878DRAFT_102129 [Calycina marina]